MTVLFRLSSLLVLPFWGLMILLPRWRWTMRVMRSPLVSAAPALFYAALVLPRLGVIWQTVFRPTLEKMAMLLGSPEGATIAWIHFLAFDLFVGRWIYLDSQERRLSALVMAPVLFLTLMLGPLGFLTYLVIRMVATAHKSDEERAQFSGAKDRRPAPIGNGAHLEPRIEAQVRALLCRAWNTSQPLTIAGAVMILVFFATLAGLPLDHRVITGAPAWLKPAKFAISTSVYCFTFVWLLGFVENHKRLARFIANMTVGSLIVEMAVILTQAARGTTSHFNMTTSLNSFLWLTMGVFILVVWAMNFMLAILLTFQRTPEPEFAWSLRLGLLVSFVGMAAAFPMVMPTPEQKSAIATGQGPRIVGAHSVGVHDGGPGLPFVGWSTVGGDLRVAHFLGIHALQVLPFLGWWIARRRNAFVHFKKIHRMALIWTVGLAYLGLVLLLAWQALRGQSVIHPDARTIVAAVALGSITGISALIIIAHANRAGLDPGGFHSNPFSRNAERALKP
jgi:hypothetical protein